MREVGCIVIANNGKHASTMFPSNNDLAQLFGATAPMGISGTPFNPHACAELTQLFGACTPAAVISGASDLRPMFAAANEAHVFGTAEHGSAQAPNPGSALALTPIVSPGTMVVERIEGATPGCYGLVLGEAYYHQQLHGVSASALKQMLRSPAHYKAWREGGNKDTAARRFGRAVHCYVLERSTFKHRYIVWDEGDRRGGDYKEFALRHADKTVLTTDEYQRVLGCAEALFEATDWPLQGFLEGALDNDGHVVVPPARCEFVIVWEDEATGLTCKMRADAMQVQPNSFIGYDAKTTGDAREEAFSIEIERMNYDLQAAHYTEGMRRFTGREGLFVFGAVEAQPAHGARHYVLGPDHDFIKNGHSKRRYALDLYAKCQRDNRWPRYEHTKPAEPVMHPWMVFRPPVVEL